MAERFFDSEATCKLMPHLGKLDEDEQPGDLMEEVRENGVVVGRQRWDSGGPGAGAGELVVYRYADKFFADDDVESLGPYDTFVDAAEAVGLFTVTDATVEVWAAPHDE
ncbi:MAG: hypothetical protein GC190_15990 [Alphaproteobacteria bacterium]|nr:hypothetical protein [Alphaproteobacteria bacterium]